MTEEVVSGLIWGPYLVAQGDSITVSTDAEVRSLQRYGISPRELSENEVTVVVQGKVLLPLEELIEPFNVAVYLYGIQDIPNADGLTAANRVIVEETGVLRGEYGIKGWVGTGDVFENHGKIRAREAAFDIPGDHATVLNTGMVISEGDVFSGSGSNQTAINTGQVYGHSGFRFRDGTGNTYVNDGIMACQGSLFVGGSLTDSLFVNNGRATIDYGTLFTLSQGSDFHVENTGTLIGYSLFYLSGEGTQASLNNSGTIKTVFGTHEESGGGKSLVIENSGLISGVNYVIKLTTTDLELLNSGTMRGDVLAGYLGNSIISNSGKMFGSITFGGENDIYAATDAGLVKGTVIGGEGADYLIGGRWQDIFDGGDQGDRLNGGAGKDTLTGGLGRDVFVFNDGCSLDTVTDFTDDLDTLELDQALWGEGKSVEQMLDDHARIIHGEVVLVFDGGNRVVLEGVTDIDALADDIILI